jgi:hypothetical protein
MGFGTVRLANKARRGSNEKTFNPLGAGIHLKQRAPQPCGHNHMNTNAVAVA